MTLSKLREYINISIDVLLDPERRAVEPKTHVLEDRFPLFSGADGIRAADHQAIRVDTQTTNHLESRNTQLTVTSQGPRVHLYITVASFWLFSTLTLLLLHFIKKKVEEWSKAYIEMKQKHSQSTDGDGAALIGNA
ncbi:hypothetical protein EYF80_000272 [Liparis tanakae]|uniref:Uncharacterized protein n=1 Tax=Liparis tanakae TaxID=230148 RepID=A0A4Z2JH82_9TELE|nr:hypothetical protein EYF80_000272 [Liparis tanakae]